MKPVAAGACVFGILLKESPIIVANAITMVLAATILFYKISSFEGLVILSF